MLEMVTNEKIELEEMDDFDQSDISEAIDFLRPRLKKRGKSKGGTSKGGPLPLVDHDAKSSLFLIQANYPAFITHATEFQQTGPNSHCPFFKYTGKATITVTDKDQIRQKADIRVNAKYRDKKNAEKIVYRKLINKIVNAVKEVNEKFGPVEIE